VRKQEKGERRSEQGTGQEIKNVEGRMREGTAHRRELLLRSREIVFRCWENFDVHLGVAC
jgi:hypothetical protein